MTVSSISTYHLKYNTVINVIYILMLGNGWLVTTAGVSRLSTWMTDIGENATIVFLKAE